MSAMQPSFVHPDLVFVMPSRYLSFVSLYLTVNVGVVEMIGMPSRSGLILPKLLSYTKSSWYTTISSLG